MTTAAYRQRAAVALVAALGSFAAPPAAAQWLDLDVPPRPAADAAAVEAGRAIYADRCWFCHGNDGDGDGPVAPYLWPRPRDFTVGSFKLRTTESGELPTDEDLFRTITLGIPGTAMPAWRSLLSDRQRWHVIAYLKTFAADLFDDPAFDPYRFVVAVGRPPRGGADALAETGRAVFEEADCWECHGAQGRGDGERAGELTDDWDFPLWPANLHLGWKLKGGSTAPDIYLRFTTGLDGTPMPSYHQTLSDEQRWQLAYYVASLARSGAQDRTPAVVITARRIEAAVPTEPADPVWETVTETHIPLTGQATFAPRWQTPAVTDLSVRAVYNDGELALWLAWDDRFPDTTAADPARAAAEGWSADDTYPVLYPDGQRARGTYPDGVELVFPTRPGNLATLPHFVYGNAGNPVDLWRWRADLQPAPASLGAVVELGASGPQRPPEERPRAADGPQGSGAWGDGRWTVVIRRALSTEDRMGRVQLTAGAMVPMTFHLWEGAHGETGLRMALSSWYFLHLPEPASGRRYAVVLLVVIVAAGIEWGAIRWMRARAAHGGLAQFGVAPARGGS